MNLITVRNARSRYEETLELKQRIRGRHGHLSNQTTFELLESFQDSSWKEFFDAPSRDCNNVEEVKESLEIFPVEENDLILWSIQIIQ